MDFNVILMSYTVFLHVLVGFLHTFIGIGIDKNLKIYIINVKIRFKRLDAVQGWSRSKPLIMLVRRHTTSGP